VVPGVKTVGRGPADRNLPGVLVVSDHMSCWTACTIGARVAVSRLRRRRCRLRAQRRRFAGNVAVRMMACASFKVIPIDCPPSPASPDCWPPSPPVCTGPHCGGVPYGHHLVLPSLLPTRARGGSIGDFPAASTPVRPFQQAAALALKTSTNRDRQSSDRFRPTSATTPAASIGRLIGPPRARLADLTSESLQLPGDDRAKLPVAAAAIPHHTPARTPGHGQRPSVLASTFAGAPLSWAGLVDLEHAATSPITPLFRGDDGRLSNRRYASSLHATAGARRRMEELPRSDRDNLGPVRPR